MDMSVEHILLTVYFMDMSVEHILLQFTLWTCQ